MSTTPLQHNEHRTFPLRTVCPINCPVLLECPDEFIPNTNVSRNRSISTDTPPLCCSGNHDTSGLVLPPPVTLSGSHPEPVVHPQMNFRSEQRVLRCVRIPLTFHLSCHVSVYICLLCIYCFFPLYSSVDPAATADYTAAEYDYVVDDPTTTVELAGKQSHSLPQISPTFPYFLALGMVTAAATIIILFNCIA